MHPNTSSPLLRILWKIQILSFGFILSACSQNGADELPPPPPDDVTFPLTVRAEIDGRSELRIQGQQIWWHHYEWEAPGMWGDDQPTLLNGEEWWPMWPLDELLNCDCDSSKETVLSTPLKSDGSTISISNIVGRGIVQIVGQPSAANNFTASIEFNDPLPDREWVTVTITQN